MLHTTRIEDSVRNGKKKSNDLKRHSQTVEYEKQALTVVPPKGYMTGDEFFSGIKKELKKRCEANGLL